MAFRGRVRDCSSEGKAHHEVLLGWSSTSAQSNAAQPVTDNATQVLRVAPPVARHAQWCVQAPVRTPVHRQTPHHHHHHQISARHSRNRRRRHHPLQHHSRLI